MQSARFGQLALSLLKDVGNGLQPMTTGWIESGPGRQFQAAEEILFDKLHSVLDAPFFIGLFHATGADFEPVMIGEVQVAGIDLGGLAERMTQDCGFTVVDHDAVRNTLKKGGCPLVTLEEVLLALTRGELQIHHAAVTQHRDEKGQSPAGGADRNEPPTAPVDLQALARAEVKRQER